MLQVRLPELSVKGFLGKKEAKKGCLGLAELLGRCWAPFRSEW